MARAVEVLPHAITASAGLVLLDDGASGLALTVKTADERLYAAKAAGRNRLVAGGDADDLAVRDRSSVPA